MKSSTSTRKTQILKANYPSKGGVIIAEDTDTALPKADKNKDNQNKPQKYREPNKSFKQYMKKDQKLPNKNIHTINSSRKPLPNNSNYSRNNHPIIPNIEEDHHTKKIHKISHKTDIVDQIVKIVNIEITIQDKIQSNLNFRLMPVPIQN